METKLFKVVNLFCEHSNTQKVSIQLNLVLNSKTMNLKSVCLYGINATFFCNKNLLRSKRISRWLQTDKKWVFLKNRRNAKEKRNIVLQLFQHVSKSQLLFPI